MKWFRRKVPYHHVGIPGSVQEKFDSRRCKNCKVHGLPECKWYELCGYTAGSYSCEEWV